MKYKWKALKSRILRYFLQTGNAFCSPKDINQMLKPMVQRTVVDSFTLFILGHSLWKMMVLTVLKRQVDSEKSWHFSL